MQRTGEADRRSRRGWLVGGLALLVVAGVVLSFALTQPPGSRPAPTSQGTSASAPPAGSTATPGGPGGTPATSPIPAPQSVVPPVSGEMVPVDLKSPSRRPSGVVVTLASIEAVDGQAILPGEVAAPAVRMTVVLRNESSAAVPLGSVVVNGYAGPERAPLESLVSPGGQPFAGTLQPGAEAKGVYLFSVPVEKRGDLTITVDPKAGEPASVLRGDARR